MLHPRQYGKILKKQPWKKCLKKQRTQCYLWCNNRHKALGFEPCPFPTANQLSGWWYHCRWRFALFRYTLPWRVLASAFPSRVRVSLLPTQRLCKHSNFQIQTCFSLTRTLTKSAHRACSEILASCVWACLALSNTHACWCTHTQQYTRSPKSYFLHSLLQFPRINTFFSPSNIKRSLIQVIRLFSLGCGEAQTSVDP